ncbi:hypothetical protein MtrunA17_Chr5g0408661 [Medicago truncatula]|uniref:Uncharacterized protein n=1 Tax=Medicago truncatula TaxID=3880 RepID=A0A396HMQ2_MEDTR|nr:hypothetical protein MtrunA17_Chr5g0408661 [Medicago truncatula]
MFLVKHKAEVHNIIINVLSRRKNLLLKFHDGGLLGHLVRTQGYTCHCSLFVSNLVVERLHIGSCG